MSLWVNVSFLRRLVLALEGIHEQLRYQNERSFPPVTTPKRDAPIRPAVIGRVRGIHQDEA